MKKFSNYIGGKWTAPGTGEYFENRNPADRSDVIGRFPLSDRADVDRAAESARRGFSVWRRTPAPARGDVLRIVGDIMTKRKEEIADAMTREMGKPLTETRGDVQEGIDTAYRSEEHTSELQSRIHIVCRLLLEKALLKPSRQPSFAATTLKNSLSQASAGPRDLHSFPTRRSSDLFSALSATS